MHGVEVHVKLVAALALVGTVLGGCKEHESLVVFALKTSQTDADSKAVELTVGPVPGGSGKVTRTFALPSGGLSMSNPTTFGVYVPSSIVGLSIPVAAVATKSMGCGGYSNLREKVTIAAAGDTVVVPVTLGADSTRARPPAAAGRREPRAAAARPAPQGRLARQAAAARRVPRGAAARPARAAGAARPVPPAPAPRVPAVR